MLVASVYGSEKPIPQRLNFNFIDFLKQSLISSRTIFGCDDPFAHHDSVKNFFPISSSAKLLEQK